MKKKLAQSKAYQQYPREATLCIKLMSAKGNLSKIKAALHGKDLSSYKTKPMISWLNLKRKTLGQDYCNYKIAEVSNDGKTDSLKRIFQGKLELAYYLIKHGLKIADSMLEFYNLELSLPVKRPNGREQRLTLQTDHMLPELAALLLQNEGIPIADEQSGSIEDILTTVCTATPLSDTTTSNPSLEKERRTIPITALIYTAKGSFQRVFTVLDSLMQRCYNPLIVGHTIPKGFSANTVVCNLLASLSRTGANPIEITKAGQLIYEKHEHYRRSHHSPLLTEQIATCGRIGQALFSIWSGSNTPLPSNSSPESVLCTELREGKTSLTVKAEHSYDLTRICQDLDIEETRIAALIAETYTNVKTADILHPSRGSQGTEALQEAVRSHTTRLLTQVQKAHDYHYALLEAELPGADIETLMSRLYCREYRCQNGQTQQFNYRFIPTARLILMRSGVCLDNLPDDSSPQQLLDYLSQSSEDSTLEGTSSVKRCTLADVNNHHIAVCNIINALLIRTHDPKTRRSDSHCDFGTIAANLLWSTQKTNPEQLSPLSNSLTRLGGNFIFTPPVSIDAVMASVGIVPESAVYDEIIATLTPYQSFYQALDRAPYMLEEGSPSKELYLALTQVLRETFGTTDSKKPVNLEDFSNFYSYSTQGLNPHFRRFMLFCFTHLLKASEIPKLHHYLSIQQDRFSFEDNVHLDMLFIDIIPAPVTFALLAEIDDPSATAEGSTLDDIAAVLCSSIVDGLFGTLKVSSELRKAIKEKLDSAPLNRLFSVYKLHFICLFDLPINRDCSLWVRHFDHESDSGKSMLKKNPQLRSRLLALKKSMTERSRSLGQQLKGKTLEQAKEIIGSTDSLSELDPNTVLEESGLDKNTLFQAGSGEALLNKLRNISAFLELLLRAGLDVSETLATVLSRSFSEEHIVDETQPGSLTSGLRYGLTLPFHPQSTGPIRHFTLAEENRDLIHFLLTQSGIDLSGFSPDLVHDTAALITFLQEKTGPPVQLPIKTDTDNEVSSALNRLSSLSPGGIQMALSVVRILVRHSVSNIKNILEQHRHSLVPMQPINAPFNISELILNLLISIAESDFPTSLRASINQQISDFIVGTYAMLGTGNNPTAMDQFFTIARLTVQQLRERRRSQYPPLPQSDPTQQYIRLVLQAADMRSIIRATQELDLSRCNTEQLFKDLGIPASAEEFETAVSSWSQKLTAIYQYQTTLEKNPQISDADLDQETAALFRKVDAILALYLTHSLTEVRDFLLMLYQIRFVIKSNITTVSQGVSLLIPQSFSQCDQGFPRFADRLLRDAGIPLPPPNILDCKNREEIETATIELLDTISASLDGSPRVRGFSVTAIAKTKAEHCLIVFKTTVMLVMRAHHSKEENKTAQKQVETVIVNLIVSLLQQKVSKAAINQVLGEITAQNKHIKETHGFSCFSTKSKKLSSIAQALQKKAEPLLIASESTPVSAVDQTAFISSLTIENFRRGTAPATRARMKELALHEADLDDHLSTIAKQHPDQLGALLKPFLTAPTYQRLQLERKQAQKEAAKAEAERVEKEKAEAAKKALEAEKRRLLDEAKAELDANLSTTALSQDGLDRSQAILDQNPSLKEQYLDRISDYTTRLKQEEAKRAEKQLRLKLTELLTPETYSLGNLNEALSLLKEHPHLQKAFSRSVTGHRKALNTEVRNAIVDPTKVKKDSKRGLDPETWILKLKQLEEQGVPDLACRVSQLFPQLPAKYRVAFVREPHYSKAISNAFFLRACKEQPVTVLDAFIKHPNATTFNLEAGLDTALQENHEHRDEILARFSEEKIQVREETQWAVLHEMPFPESLVTQLPLSASLHARITESKTLPMPFRLSIWENEVATVLKESPDADTIQLLISKGTLHNYPVILLYQALVACLRQGPETKDSWTQTDPPAATDFSSQTDLPPTGIQQGTQTEPDYTDKTLSQLLPMTAEPGTVESLKARAAELIQPLTPIASQDGPRTRTIVLIRDLLAAHEPSNLARAQRFLDHVALIPSIFSQSPETVPAVIALPDPFRAIFLERIQSTSHELVIGRFLSEAVNLGENC